MSTTTSDGTADEGLSEYELLRNHNIKRNQNRLGELGLLTSNNTSAITAVARGNKEKGGKYLIILFWWF